MTMGHENLGLSLAILALTGVIVSLGGVVLATVVAPDAVTEALGTRVVVATGVVFFGGVLAIALHGDRLLAAFERYAGAP